MKSNYTRKLQFQPITENVTLATLKKWVMDTFGRSALARRIEAFLPEDEDIIVA